MTAPLHQRGQVANIEVVPFGMLVVVVGILLATSAWAALDATSAASAAARQAARAYVEAPDRATALVAARRSAEEALAGHGRDPARATIELRHEDGGTWQRCTLAVAEVSYVVPSIVVPFVGGWGELEVSSRHAELVDPHRAGVPGEACR